MRIGVLLPNWVGDVVMATPTLRALRTRYPSSEILGICRPYLVPLLAGSDLVDRFLPWEHHGPGWMGRTARLVHELRSEKLDAMLVLRNSPYAAIVARLSGAHQTVGYARRGSGLLLTRGLAPPRSNGKFLPISAVDYFLELARAIGCEELPRELELATLPADECAADALWRRLDLPVSEEVVLLNAGGAYGSAKRWPHGHCVELSRLLAEELGFTVLVLCGPAERNETALMEAAADHPRVKSLAREDVSFGVTKAIIRRSRLLITTDSGPRHMAAALGTPTVTLFGPIDPHWSENYQTDAVHLQLDLDCSPCGKRVCPLGHGRCMWDLTPDLVLQAVARVLESTAVPQAA